MESVPQRQLLIIGGAEDKEGDCAILREFVRRANGQQANLVVMTAATRIPGEVGEDYIRIFERLGAEEVKVIDTDHRDDASDPEAIALIKQATGVFFTGGDQSRITRFLEGTDLHKTLLHRLSEGVVIAGTSAGAAMMPDVMIIEGDSETNPRPDVVKLGPGMGFLPGVVVDQHFAQRGRIGRLLSAIAQQPVDLGFGIDEDTAIAINGNDVEVIGNGAVTVVDVSGVVHTNIDSILKDEDLAICNAKLHVLPRGYRFNLAERSPICP